MTLKELRASKNLTQQEVAILVGISLRSYKQYENDASKEKTIKYDYIYNKLLDYGYIDEEHGLLNLEEITKRVDSVLVNYDVEYCYLFGSYAKNKEIEKSDVDLLVSTKVTGLAYFGLAEELREKLQKRVDLLNINQLINNQELLNEILKDGIRIYKKSEH